MGHPVQLTITVKDNGPNSKVITAEILLLLFGNRKYISGLRDCSIFWANTVRTRKLCDERRLLDVNHDLNITINIKAAM